MTQLQKEKVGWKFIGDQGDFSIDKPNESSYLYFPLANEAGMLSAISPILHGDIKSSQYTFLTPPVSLDELHNSKASRNFWVYIAGKGPWSAAGNSVTQKANLFVNELEQVTLDAGFLWHKVVRVNPSLGIKSEIISFVPIESDKVELMKITITNTSSDSIRITPTAAIPLYGRSADEIRDHRHVTSLLHRMYTLSNGIELQPALTFDERGHRINHVSYSVLAREGEEEAPVGFFPILEEYIGEGGSLDWPESIVKNLSAPTGSGTELEGYESMGAIRFRDAVILPGQSKCYTIAMVISNERINEAYYLQKYVSTSKFDLLFQRNIQFWQNKINAVAFQSGNHDYDVWMKWVTLQPILRRIYGNSFLPSHDYGRGGRGWRDLWQDCLALLITEPADVRHLLFNNFAGVRIDGSNATIIGTKSGEFVADRNNIPRVWMDHGTWPFLTTLFYINQSGDLPFLLQEQCYFKDKYIKRSKDIDLSWKPEEGNQLKTAEGQVYQGSILEHLLLQNLVPFFNVGEHNNIKLEGADWNDGLDLASDRGESVAFTAFYASNLVEISKLLLSLKEKLGLDQIELAEEMNVLLDSIFHSIDYDSIIEKLALLDRYYETCPISVSGKKVSLSIEAVAQDLAKKAGWIFEHIRKNEWIQNSAGYAWFNGYYNNDGIRVEGDHPAGVRITLTGQVFAIMGGSATDEQVRMVASAVDKYLKDPQIGYRLNSRFGTIQQNLGRAFGFAYGHKENGAMFSHMSVMYANALYKRGFVKEGHEVLSSIYKLSTDFERSRIYPGIPEYINEKGRGMYPYLTGSASWLLLTMVTEVFGVKGKLGDLQLEPKLLIHQFDDNHQASMVTLFADKTLKIVYKNAAHLDYKQYKIGKVTLNNQEVLYENLQASCIIKRQILTSLPDQTTHTIEVFLQK
ncbi:MAG: cellobiose phosphorylase [Bacilli bacterium]|nr:cellobiose phosphorylase [Bacilli bacterium]